MWSAFLECILCEVARTQLGSSVELLPGDVAEVCTVCIFYPGCRSVIGGESVEGEVGVGDRTLAAPLCCATISRHHSGVESDFKVRNCLLVR